MPLKGVLFEIRKENGEIVCNELETDAKGRIYVELPAGNYHITELQGLDCYEVDSTVHKINIRAGKAEVLRITNKPLSGLRLLKKDSITGKGIYGVEFMVFDANNKVVGNFYTDNNGVIDFSSILVEGRYTLRETRPANGYYPDDIPRTVEFVAGKVTEVVWTNVPRMGQIQITKYSEDDNQVNGLPAGSLLEGAIFEVMDYKTGNVVDKFVTASNGRGVSQPLPLGRYVIKEVQAPSFYQLNNKELDVTVEFATQIVKLDFTNKSANTGVYIKKTGNIEATPGTNIGYDIKSIQNTSTIPLSDFFWRDVLPTDAVRLTRIVTGTFNQALNSKIIVTTNKGNTKIIADNLSTTMNHVIDCSNASLGLPNDEYVTSFTVFFGTVKAGFASVEQPQVYVNVLNNLPSGYQFANKVDVGGKTGNEWVVGNSTWLTTIHRYTSDKLPKTGW